MRREVALRVESGQRAENGLRSHHLTAPRSPSRPCQNRRIIREPLRGRPEPQLELPTRRHAVVARRPRWPRPLHPPGSSDLHIVVAGHDFPPVSTPAAHPPSAVSRSADVAASGVRARFLEPFPMTPGTLETPVSDLDAASLHTHDRALRRLARSLAGDEHSADDLVQDTWAAALATSTQPRSALA